MYFFPFYIPAPGTYLCSSKSLIMTIGIIGAGSMGSGIAQVAATAGHQVVLYDAAAEAVAKALAGMEKTLGQLETKGKLPAGGTATTLSRIEPAQELSGLQAAECVIEAIVENLEIKKSLFRALEPLVSPHCILATNTSSLSVTALAAVCERPERCIGLHFFNPAPIMRLVELAPALQTSEAVMEQAETLMRQWGKTPVRVKDTPGFIVNRVARPFYGEALRILDEGMAGITAIDRAMTELAGFRMGPFALMDLIGHDVNYTVTETVFQSFFYDPRYRPSFTQKRLVEAGRLGRKSGRGFYIYKDGAAEPDSRYETATPYTEELGRQIVRRIVAMLINEAADALFWGIASREDIDLAMTLGVNYPKGLLRWADEWGAAECVQILDSLYDEYGEDRYRCSPLLRRVGDGK